MMAAQTRTQAYHSIQVQLLKLSDSELREQLLAANEKTVFSTCARTTVIDVDGRKVFVKRIPLSKLEYDHPMSTANLFNLPVVYQYGIDSRGFTAWRELMGHMITTDWVLSGQIQSFPLLYHHRVMPAISLSEPISKAEEEQYVAYWDNNQEIRTKLKSISTATHELVLFIEYFPYVLADWVYDHMADKTKMNRLFEEAWNVFGFMRSQGMTHFDSHWKNILTDGKHLYLSDFGLVTCEQFDLADEERAFVKRHAASIDYALFAFCLFPPLKKLTGLDSEAAARLISASDAEAQAIALGIPEAFAKLIGRYGILAALMAEFHNAIVKDKSAPYPQNRLEKALE